MDVAGSSLFFQKNIKKGNDMIRVFSDIESLSRSAADLFVETSQQAIADYERFSVALSGGNTPRRLYEILATAPRRDQIQWQFIHVFWGDERCVSPTDPRSNFLMTRETLLKHVPIPTTNIHPVCSDLSPENAAIHYESQLRKFFGNQPPAFDLILLGLGDNAHTASLFPHTPVLNETERWVSEVYTPESELARVTLTAPLINQANQVVFLVSGADKAQALQNVIEGTYQPHELPAQLIRPNGAHPTWLVDKAAAHKLTVEIEPEETY
jgi:6-phosphogluconolactonase